MLLYICFAHAHKNKNIVISTTENGQYNGRASDTREKRDKKHQKKNQRKKICRKTEKPIISISALFVCVPVLFVLSIELNSHEEWAQQFFGEWYERDGIESMDKMMKKGDGQRTEREKDRETWNIRLCGSRQIMTTENGDFDFFSVYVNVCVFLFCFYK